MKKKNKKRKIFPFIISISLIILSFILFYFIKKLNVLETKYLIGIGILQILLYALVILKLFRNKTKKIVKFLFYVFSIMLITGYSIGIKYISTTINFFENITATSKEKQNYSVFVLKNSNYQSINDLNNKNIGFLSTDINKEKTIEKFKSKSQINFNEIEGNITELVSNLNDNKVDAMVLDNSIISLLEENKIKINEDIKEIFSYTIYINRINKNKKVDVTKDAFAFYISGSDSKEGISDTDRSDVNIVAVVNPKVHKILLINIPRDTYVQLHGTTGVKDKLTHAGMYGVNMSVSTIEDLLDISINYNAKVSFATLINSVDVMGGIEITSEKAFTPSGNKKCKFVKGTQHVNGECALAFARERKHFVGGDYTRGEHQQQVITAMINKMSDPSVLTKYNEILNAINGSFTTNITYNEITSLIKSQISSMKGWHIESTSIGGDNGYDYTYSMGNQKLYVTYPSEKSIENIQKLVNEVLYAK